MANDLDAQAREQERFLVRALGDVARDLEGALRAYQRGIRGSNVPRRASELIRYAETLRDALDDAGFERVAENFASKYPSLTRESLGYFEAAGLAAADNLTIRRTADRGMLRAFVEYSETRLREQVLRDFYQPVRDEVFRAAFGQADTARAVQAVQETGASLTPARTTVLIDDMYSQYMRSVKVFKAEELGLRWYYYSGPLDSRNSDQCRTMKTFNRYGVEGYYRKSDITTRLHPALTRDPLIGGGHPNCRHQFLPISNERAQRLGLTDG